jgi:hypothetical protein
VISELMARGAPTERLVDPFYLLYGLLMMAFGVGVWMSGPRKRVRITGGLLFAYAAIGLFGPTVFEMNMRGRGGNATADVLHIALTGVLVVLIFASVAFGASIWGRWFRLYSMSTLLMMVVFGVLTSLAMRGIGTGERTPWVGVMERIDIGAFLLWVLVLAISLFRVQATHRRGRRAEVSAGAMPPVERDLSSQSSPSCASPEGTASLRAASRGPSHAAKGRRFASCEDA